MFLTKRFYLSLALIAVLMGCGFAFAPLYSVSKVLLAILACLVAAETSMLLLYNGIKARRTCAERFSNGDDNEVRIRVENHYPFATAIEVIDEIPPIFQRRDINFRSRIPRRLAHTITYSLRPVQRGVYSFGKIIVLASSPLGLVQRKYVCGKDQDVKVNPSYIMLHQYELLAISNHLTDLGIKRIRRIGHHTEFEQIKDYVRGDDFRSINWKATARRNQLMVNVYQEESSQQVYNIIDKGRTMQHAFQGMTLLDYAINAALVLSYVAINKEDKAGLVTIRDTFDTYVKADKRQGQMQSLLEALYAEKTDFSETDFSVLVANLNKHISKRSLFILYTSFTTLQSMRRQLPYLLRLSQRHRLLVVFFEDDEIRQYISSKPNNTEDYYNHVIAEKFAYEQRLIVDELKQHGIYTLLTTPANLSVEVINKYIDMRAIAL